MKILSESLETVWFGMDKSQTEQYFRRLLHMQESEAGELEYAIKMERKVRSQLERALAAKRLSGEPEGGVKADHLQVQLAVRMERSLEVLRMQGDSEVKALKSMANSLEAEHQLRLSHLEQETAAMKQALQELLNETQLWVSKLQAKHGIDMRPLEAEMETALKLARPTPVSDVKFGDAVEDEAALKEDSLPTGPSSNTKVVQFRLKTILADLESKHRAMESRWKEEAVTSDGTAVHRRDPAHASPPATLELPISTGAYTTSGLRPDSADIIPKLNSSPTGFWGDLTPYLFHNSAPSSHEISDAKPEVPSITRPVERQEQNGHRTQEKPHDQDLTVSSAAAVSGSQNGSPALSAEIKSLQHRYIVGKSAGEHLYGLSGKLIIAQGAVITTEVIEEATQAGKLSELIVNMTIPGFGEEE